MLDTPRQYERTADFLFNLNDPAAPSLSNAPALRGVTSRELLSRSQVIGDFNGDRHEDLMVWGATRAYVLLGPIQLDAIEDAALRAEVIIELNGWFPATGSSDINGDGLDDLVFSKRSAASTSVAVLPGSREPIRNQAVDEQTRKVITVAGIESSSNRPIQFVDFGKDNIADLLLPGAFISGASERLGYVFDGADLRNTFNSATTPLTETSAAVDIRHNMLAIEATFSAQYPEYTGPTSRTVGGNFSDMRVADIDGDGKDEIILGVDKEFNVNDGLTTFATSGIYVLDNFDYTQATGTDIVSLAGSRISTLARHIIQQPSSVGAFDPVRFFTNLGDLNRDGREDFAIHTRFESNTSDTATALIFYGQRSHASGFNGDTNSLLPLNQADIKIRSLPVSAYASNRDGAEVVTDISSGDFDGDDRKDLAIGRSQTTFKSGTTIINSSDRGSLNVLWDISQTAATLGGTILLSNPADDLYGDPRLEKRTVIGTSTGDRLGRVILGTGTDFNGDGFDDLIVGASGAEALGASSIPQAGALYAIYGSPRRAQIPATYDVFTNQSLDVVGDVLVDSGNGRPAVHPSALPAGSDSRTIRFTTLGDGLAGNTLRLVSFPDGFSGSQQSVFAPSVTIVGEGGHRLPGGQVGSDSNAFRVGGAAKIQAAIEFDLSGLMQAYDDPNDVVSALLSLDASITGQAITSPSLTLDGSLSSASAAVGNSRTFFMAQTTELGREFWATSGISGSTRLLSDFSPGTSDTEIQRAIVSGDNLFFTTKDPDALWVNTGGSTNSLITNSLPPISGIAAWQGQALFIAGGNLYKTIVGVGATFELIRTGVSSSALSNTISLNNKLFFMDGGTLFVTDGTAAGTFALRPFVAGGDGIPSLSQAIAFNNKIYFAADSDTDALTTNNGQTELWMSDGTVAGTLQVRTFDTVPANPPPLSTASNPPLTTAEPWINEFHYDNTDPDANESVEIGGPAGYSLTGWSLALYGPTGTQYGTVNLSGTLPSQRSGFGFRSFSASGLHDGPAGIALVGPGAMIRQFISYEGTITATNGPAIGRTSTNVGVSETSTNTSDKSLQLAGKLGSFTWQAPSSSSQNFPNAGQYFLSPPREFKVVGSRMVFLVEDSVFVSDGTAGGTTSVGRINAVSNAILRTQVVGSKYFILHQSTSSSAVSISVLDLSGPTPVLNSSYPATGFSGGLGETSQHNGSLVFSSADRKSLWSSDGTARGTSVILSSESATIKDLVALSNGRLMLVGPANTEGTATTLLVMNPGGFVPITLADADPTSSTVAVSLLGEEGDGFITGRDFSSSATTISSRVRTTSKNSQRVEFDLGNAIRNAIASGKTKISLKLTTNATNVQWTIQQPALNAETGLRITRRPKLVADLLDKDGGIIEAGFDAMDMRYLNAGTYFLKVYNPDTRFIGWNIPFQIEMIPPEQGQVRSLLSDSDRIEGGDGDDTLVGGRGLDELFGESGTDVFVGENFETRDSQASELHSPISIGDRLMGAGSEIDPIINIPDPGLRLQIAKSLGIAMIDRTGSGSPLAMDFAEGVRASDLAKLTELPPAPPLYIYDLDGLEYATNLVGLDLSGQSITDIASLVPAVDPAGTTTGLSQLRYINLNGSVLTDLWGLSNLRQLRVLMNDLPNQSERDIFRIDVFQPENSTTLSGFPDFSSLRHVAVGSGTSLSLTRAQLAALNMFYPGGTVDISRGPLAVRFSGQFYLDNGGTTQFEYAIGANGRLFVDGMPLNNLSISNGNAVGDIHLSPGWHNFRLERIEYADGGSYALRIREPDFATLQFFSSAGQRLNAGMIGDIEALSNLEELRYLSLANQSISDLTPLAEIENPITGQSSLWHIDLSGNQVRELNAISGLHIIDSGDFTEGYSERSGTWTVAQQAIATNSPISGAFEGDDRRARRTSGTSDDATWTFTNLVLDEEYDVLVTWASGDEHAFAANYRIVGNETITATVNQSLQPASNLMVGVQAFQKIGRMSPDTSGTIKVDLNSFDNGRIVIADAVAIRRANHPHSRLMQVDLRNNPLDNRDLAYSVAELNSRQQFGFQIAFDEFAGPAFTSTLGNISLSTGVNTIPSIANTLNLTNVGAGDTLLVGSLGATEVLRYRMDATSRFSGVMSQLRNQPIPSQQQPHFSDGELVNGNLYIADSRNNRVLKVSESTGEALIWTNVVGGALDLAVDSQYVYVLKQTGIVRLDHQLNVVNDNFTAIMPTTDYGAIEIGPGGDLYVAKYRRTLEKNGVMQFVENSIQRYNRTTGAFVSEFVPITNANLWTAVDLASDGTSLFVANMALNGAGYNILRFSSAGVFQGTIFGGYAFDNTDPNARPRIEIGRFGSNNTYLYLADSTSGIVQPINPTNGSASTPVISAGTGGLTSATFLAFGDQSERSHFKYEVSTSYRGVTGFVDGNGALQFTVSSGVNGPVDVRLRAYETAEGHRGKYAEYAFTAHVNRPAIYGTVYQDIDRDNIRDGGELGLAGVRVVANKIGNNVIESEAWTDANGRFVLTNMPTDPMQIRVMASEQMVPGNSATVSVTNTTLIQNLELGAFRVLDAGPNVSWPEGSALTLHAKVTDPLIAYDYSWTVRDNSDTVTLASGNTPSLVFTPTDQGHYIARLSAREPNNPNPFVDRVDIFANAVPASALMGDPVIMPEGRFTRTVPLNDPGTENYDIVINYGDGRSDSIVTLIDYSSPSIELNHVYRDQGNFTLTLTIVNRNPSELVDEPLQTFTLPISVSNAIPAIQSATMLGVVREGVAATLRVVVDDPSGYVNFADNGWRASIEWGDGQTTVVSPLQALANAFDIAHTYPDNGSYNIRITLLDEDGDASSTTIPVTVLNIAPALVVNNRLQVIIPDGGVEGSELTFAANAYDPGADVLSYNWTIANHVYTGATVHHTFPSSGVYAVSVMVSDGDGGKDGPYQFQVSIDNVPPQITPIADQFALEGTIIQFDPIAVVSDPGMLSETYTLDVDWGDGTTSTYGPSSLGQSGLLVASHAYPDEGNYTVRLRVVDSDGDSSDSEITEGDLDGNTFTVTVRNAPPAVQPVASPPSVVEGVPFTISNLVTFSDPTGLAFVGAVFGEVYNYSIDWGDGTIPVTGTVTPTLQGIAGITPTRGAVNAGHTYANNGTYRVAVTIDDGDGGIGMASFLMNVENVAPSLAVSPIPSNLNTNRVLSISGSANDVPADNLTVYVDVGDGLRRRALRNTLGSGFQFTHLYENPGTYPLRVIAIDDDGGERTEFYQLQVSAEARVDLVGAPIHEESSSVSYRLTIQNLEVLSGGSFSNAVINWGDGSSTPLDSTQFMALLGSGQIDLEHRFADDGPINGHATVAFVLIRADQSTYTVATKQIDIRGSAPTATVSNSGPHALGSPAVVSLSSVFDASASDLQELRFSFDFNNDGDFNDVGDRFLTTSTELSVPSAYLANTGSHVIRVRVSDDEGLFSDYTTTLIITADTTAPASSVSPLPPQATSLDIPIYVIGSDPVGANEASASGIFEYDVFVSVDSGPFTHFITLPYILPAAVFRAESNHTYFFRSVARDRAGNIESEPIAPDTQIRVGDLEAPETRVVSAVANSAGLFSVQVSGRELGGSQLRYFDLYVSIDGGTAELVSSIAAGIPDGTGSVSATVTYQGVADGLAHRYRFFSIGRDISGNIEFAPNHDADVIVETTIAPLGLQPTGIDVQLSAEQRSYIRYVDVLFSSEIGLAELLLLSPIQVERFALNATDTTPGTGTSVSGFAVSRIGDRLRLDWGINGITGNRTNNAGDGLYRIKVDGNADGDYADAVDRYFEFARLLGDANGDEQVNDADLAIVNAQFGRIGPSLNGDVDGSYFVNPGVASVNTIDRTLVNNQKNLNRRLSDHLKTLLDD